MIKNYTEFVNEDIKDVWGNEMNTNKGLLGQFKNLFGSLMKNVSDEFKKPVEDLTSKLDKSKDVEKSKKIINDFLKIHNETLNNSINDAKNIKEIVEIFKNNLISVYTAINAATKSLGDKYKFEEIFGDSPQNVKKLFNKNEKKFMNNVGDFAENQVLAIGKQFGYDKIEENYSKIYEADEELSDEEQKEQIEEATDENENNKDNKDNKDNKKDEQNLNNLKKSVINWFQNIIYKKVQDDLKKIKKEETKNDNVSIEDKLKNIKSTDNINSVKSIINKITDVDKNTLIKVRNTLGLNKENTPL